MTKTEAGQPTTDSHRRPARCGEFPAEMTKNLSENSRTFDSRCPSHVISSLGHDVALGDLDGDGDLDAFMANGTPAGAGNTVWLNDGSGILADSGLLLGSGFSMGVALGDLDADGDLDAVIANTSFVDNPAETPNEVWFNLLTASR